MENESNLRRRVNLLTPEERRKVLSRIEALYKECRVLNSDDFSLDNNKHLSADDSVKRDVPVETVVAIVNEYHNCGKSVSKIMEEKKLTTFEVIAALCEYIFKQQGTISRSVDFTEAIRYMYAEQFSIIRLIDLMLEKNELKLVDVITELLCMPSLCLLSLTLIWIELKNPKMANLFDRNWEKFDYPEITEDEFRALDDQIQHVFQSYTENGAKFVSDVFPADQINDHLQMVREVVDERTKVISDTLKSIKELDQTINKRPTLEVETILSDSSDSENNAPENDEICVLMQKVTGKWLQTDLTHELLSEEINLVKLNFYFTKSTVSIVAGKMIESFVMCKMIELDENSYRVQFLLATNPVRDVKACDLAMGRAPAVRCPEGTRVIALYNPNKSGSSKSGSTIHVSLKESYWIAGTVGAKPLMQNRFEYLIFFDNGIDCYIPPENIRLMVEQPIDQVSKKFEPRLAYTFVKNIAKQNFIKKYLHVFPDWPLIRLKKSENTMRVLTRRDGREESAFVLDVDRQMCLLRFPSLRIGPAGKTGRDCVIQNCTEHEHVDEWVYRGNSDRFPTLQSSATPADRRSSARRLGRNRSRFEIALPEYDRGLQHNVDDLGISTGSKGKTIQTARKSNKRQTMETESSNASISASDADLITKRRLSNKIKMDRLTPPDWSHLKYKPHKQCSSRCISPQKLDLKLEQFVPCSPYFIPLIFGWTREFRRVKAYGGRGDSRVIVVYRAPCGKRFLGIKEVAKYLQLTAIENLTIDLFSFNVDIRPNVIARPFKSEWVLQDDFAKGLEDVNIPVVNAISKEKSPSMTYRARRFADSSIIDGSVQPQFCSGCSCTDNCSDSTKCECQQLTINSNDRLSASLRVNRSKTYQYRSLSEKVISGLYECNDMCSCSKKLCYNRVVQQNIKIPLQLYMTAETGWGVRTLVDIPAGTFICTYSGRLLTDRMAELQGREVSDMYLAELDLHEVVEAEKQQQGIDLIDDDEGIATGDESDLATTEMGQIGVYGDSRKDDPTLSTSANVEEQEVSAIDEELAARFNEEIVQNKPSTSASSRSTLAPFNFETYFGDNALFIVDAQESGNIGRFLNHSCEPNVYVQMVLVDTHDLRLPWVAFFAETFVKAGEELRWNYGYSPNSVPGKVLICKCGSQHCQGRLL